MQAIKALTPLVRKLGPKANPANIKIPRAAAAAWALYIGQSQLQLWLNSAHQDGKTTRSHVSSSCLWCLNILEQKCYLATASQLSAHATLAGDKMQLVHRICECGTIQQLAAWSACICCGVEDASGDLALQHQLLLCQSGPQLGWRAPHRECCSKLQTLPTVFNSLRCALWLLQPLFCGAAS